MTDIMILDGARTAIGTFGGSLANTTAIDLGAAVSKAALERSGVEPGQIGTVSFGHVINTRAAQPVDVHRRRGFRDACSHRRNTRQVHIAGLGVDNMPK